MSPRRILTGRCTGSGRRGGDGGGGGRGVDGEEGELPGSLRAALRLTTGLAAFTFPLLVVLREAHLSPCTLITSLSVLSSLLLNQGHTWQVVYVPSYLM